MRSEHEERLNALRHKLEQGLPLDEQECQLLDSELQREGPEAMWVRELPEEEPSLAWRSSLNAQLGTMAKAQRRKLVWRYGSVAATVCAGALAAIFVVQMTPSPTPPAGGVEEMLVQSHEHWSGTVGMDVTSVPEPLLWNASM